MSTVKLDKFSSKIIPQKSLDFAEVLLVYINTIGRKRKSYRGFCRSRTH